MSSQTSAGVAAKATRPTGYRWYVMATIFVGYLICMADRSNIGALLPFIKEEFEISNTQSGLISSMFFLGYAVSQIPAGLIMGRTGTRKMVSWAIFAFSLVTFLMGFTTTAVILLVLRLLLGLTEGPAPVGMTSTINNWFPAKEKGTATGIYIASTQLAPMIVPPLAAAIALGWGWRAVFFVLAIPGFIMALVWYLVVRNRPGEAKRVNQAELALIADTSIAKAETTERPWMKVIDKIIRYREVPALGTNKEVLKSWNVWGDTLAYFFMNNVNYGMLTWIPAYLVAERGYDFIKMGFVASAPAAGGLIGALIGGAVSDRLFNGRRKPTMILTAFATALMMVVVLNVPQNTVLVAGSLMLTGFCLNIGWPMFTSYAMNITTGKTYPFAISVINSGGNLGGFFAPLIVGVLLDMTGGNYNVAFSYFVVVLLIALLVIFTLTEARPQKTEVHASK